MNRGYSESGAKGDSNAEILHWIALNVYLGGSC
jgi:hypothetical protein